MGECSKGVQGLIGWLVNVLTGFTSPMFCGKLGPSLVPQHRPACLQRSRSLICRDRKSPRKSHLCIAANAEPADRSEPQNGAEAAAAVVEVCARLQPIDNLHAQAAPCLLCRNV